MKARLLTRAITTGHVATDYLRLVHANQNPSKADTRPDTRAAQEVLEFFEGQDQSLPSDPVGTDQETGHGIDREPPGNAQLGRR